MSIMTAWGYELPNTTTLSDMLTVTEFNTFTGGKYTSDTRTASEIASACSAIRNYCGWHIYPSLSCSIEKVMLYGDGAIKRVGQDVMIQLPATYVSAVSSVKIDNTAYTDFVCNTNGMLHVFDVAHTLNRKSVIEVEYTAGIGDDQIKAIKELIAHQVTHALATSYGVTSESAGGMSITYNASWANNTRATGLSSSDKEVLTPYRVQGVF